MSDEQRERKEKAKIIFDLDMAKKGEWVREARKRNMGLVDFIIAAVDENLLKEKDGNYES